MYKKKFSLALALTDAAPMSKNKAVDAMLLPLIKNTADKVGDILTGFSQSGSNEWDKGKAVAVILENDQQTGGSLAKLMVTYDIKEHDLWAGFQRVMKRQGIIMKKGRIMTGIEYQS